MNLDAAVTFSPNYERARQRFRDAGRLHGWELEAHPIDESGSTENDQSLTVDVAQSPPRKSERVVIVSSGLHGVEGFFGSAVQLAFLERWPISAAAQSSVRLLFVHALNPYGFASLRRVDAENIDPNRNFLLPGETYTGSPKGYQQLQHLLNPRCPPSRWEPFTLKALWRIVREGLPTLQQAIAQGQYEFPQGLFYGGDRASQTNVVLSKHLDRWLDGAKEVVHLDFHTGLGRWAKGKLLIDYPLTAKQRSRLIQWYGPHAFQDHETRGPVFYHTQGGFGQWCVARNRDRDYLYACAEFGTYSPLRVLTGLRMENQAHHWGRPKDSAMARAKQTLKELFCPISKEWRRIVIASGVELVETAIRGLADNGHPSGLVGS